MARILGIYECAKRVLSVFAPDAARTQAQFRKE